MTVTIQHEGHRHILRSVPRRPAAWCLLAVLLTAAGCSAPAPDTKDIAAPAPTVSSDQLLAAAEADIEVRRFQLAYQSLARMDQTALETSRARLAAGEALLGLGQPKQALAEIQAIQTDEAYRARAY